MYKELLQEEIRSLEKLSGGTVYEKSVHTCADGIALMVNKGAEDKLLASAGVGLSGEKIRTEDGDWILAPLSHENAVLLRKIFSFTAPVPVLRGERTVGVGDRLGIAAPGHIRVFEKYDALPVFAQQSVRELTLTGRSFENVLDCVTFAVFREDYTKGFGADGDHLKNRAEVAYALSCGYSMITLDCSEYIRNDIYALSDEEVNDLFSKNGADGKEYIGKTFEAGSCSFCFSEQEFKRTYLIYHDAVEFAARIYQEFFAGKEGRLDFEMSIDETAVPTEPYQHFYIANELAQKGVKPATIAPRFCGEFQKGIDYIGDVRQFDEEIAVHAAIAEKFGYKISVHSGSDKFSVFPYVGERTKGRYHLKTAGTNWLEAMAIIAEKDPALYREIHQFALTEAFAEAEKYYHVTTDLTKIPLLSDLSDEELPGLFELNDARQLIHITYGQILTVRKEDGTLRFRDRLYKIWRENREEYAKRLERHISRHLDLLNCKTV